MATAYGSALGLSSTGLLLALLLTQIVAFPFAIIFGRLAKKYSAEKLITVCIVTYLGVAIFAIFLHYQWQFWVLAVWVGMFQGDIRRVRNWLLVITGLLTAVTTAFCGPVAFIGLAVPHVARMILGTANHNSLLPVTILSGGAVALLCNLICVLPGEAGIIPLNAVTPIIGAPVIIYVILSQRKPQQFN